MSHAASPAELPEVHDEAGDTPGWLPITGVVLLLILLFVMVARPHLAPEERPVMTGEPSGAVEDGAHAFE